MNDQATPLPPAPDIKALDAAMQEAREARDPALPRRFPMDERVKVAMTSVDEAQAEENYRIEAFIDQAIHQRIIAVRGVYLPGPRDMRIRRAILDALNSITASGM